MGDGDQTPFLLLPGRGDPEMGNAVLKLCMAALCLGGPLGPGGGRELRAQPPELWGGRAGEDRLRGVWSLPRESSSGCCQSPRESLVSDPRP